MGVLGLMFLVVPVFAMIAWAMGSSERRAIERGDASSNNRILVDIGYYLGIAGTIIGVTICLGCCLLPNVR